MRASVTSDHAPLYWQRDGADSRGRAFITFSLRLSLIVSLPASPTVYPSGRSRTPRRGRLANLRDAGVALPLHRAEHLPQISRSKSRFWTSACRQTGIPRADARSIRVQKSACDTLEAPRLVYRKRDSPSLCGTEIQVCATRSALLVPASYHKRGCATCSSFVVPSTAYPYQSVIPARLITSETTSPI
jgi:hypothetical protein